ncbi:glycerophosphoryl diester phosphodiesterase membrane domain-containing protein, partial [Caldilinea sp.]|uniref:glycerophosphoryl diester phosphodiesterase membrane domain-containing protein n=1 Tax=Caldilinea sp. TaxID=2293560 RepID=UPI001B15E015
FILIFIFAGVLTALGGALDSDSVVVAVGAVILIIALFFGLMFLLLLPLAYLTTRWLVAPVVIMTELKGPVDALKRSWRLTEGSFWRLFGLLVLLFILNGIVLALPLSLIQFIAFAVTPSQMFGLLNGALSGLSNLLSILWYPLLALTLTLVYYDLRVRKENYDLELRIQALEASARPSNPSTP